jgi:RNA polymerase sporulation-specific sigma factor
LTEKDEVLVISAQRGDTRSFDELLRRYKSRVRTKSRGNVPPGLEREDILQEGMIGLFKAIRDYSPASGAPFGAFADMCVERQITTAIRSAMRKKHTPLNLSLPLDASEATEDNDLMRDHKAVNPLRSLIDKEEFKQARKTLTEREAAVLGLRLNGKSYQAISNSLGISAKAVDNALRRARQKLGQ